MLSASWTDQKMDRSKKIALAIAAVAIFWIVTGVVFPSKHDSSSSGSQVSTEEQALTSVRVRISRAEPMERDVLVTGRTQASRFVAIKAETDGQVALVVKGEGEQVSEGEVLAKLKLRDRKARVREARHFLDQRKIQYTAAKELEQKGFGSKLRLAEARSQYEAAKAQLKDANAELERVEIRAPYKGVIDNQEIETGDFLTKGDTVFSIIDLNPIEIVGFLTERQVVDVAAGMKAYIRLLNNKVISGDVSYVAPSADPQTRTFRMEITAENEETHVKDGLTAEIRIPTGKQLAHKISPSILSLRDDGIIGVKLVNDKNITQFVPVNLVMDTPEYLWVSGLPEEAKIVTVGQDFVIPGQKVKPVLSEEGGLL